MFKLSQSTIISCRVLRDHIISKLNIAVVDTRCLTDSQRLKKLFNKGGKAKKKWYNSSSNIMQDTNSSMRLKKSAHRATLGQMRRADQVGTVLNRHIVHLVNSGELCPKLAELSVQIIRVKVVPDFSAVNVYWLSTGSDDNAYVEQLLKKKESTIRERLISYHVLGIVPRVNFIRDDSQAHYMEIMELLKAADFGPDFEPARLDTTIRTEFLKAYDMKHKQEGQPHRQQHHTVRTDRVGRESDDASLQLATCSMDNPASNITPVTSSVFESRHGAEMLAATQSAALAEDALKSFQHQQLQPSDKEQQAVSVRDVGDYHDRRADDLPYGTRLDLRDNICGVQYNKLLNKIKAMKHPEHGVSSDQPPTLATPISECMLSTVLKKKSPKRRTIVSEATLVKDLAVSQRTDNVGSSNNEQCLYDSEHFASTDFDDYAD